MCYFWIWHYAWTEAWSPENIEDENRCLKKYVQRLKAEKPAKIQGAKSSIIYITPKS